MTITVPRQIADTINRYRDQRNAARRVAKAYCAQLERYRLAHELAQREVFQARAERDAARELIAKLYATPDRRTS